MFVYKLGLRCHIFPPGMTDHHQAAQADSIPTANVHHSVTLSVFMEKGT